MERYIPPFEISNKMLMYVASISEKIGEISYVDNLKVRPNLRKNNKIKSIHSSLKIEANSLSLGQVKDIINGRIVLDQQKEIQEVKNAYAAYELISQIDPYSLEELNRLHGIMTKYTVDEPGRFRSGEEGVFDGDKCIFMAPPAKMVPELMGNLFEWMKRDKDNVHPLILSAVFHYEFVFIHPFTDGNGRMARLWHTVLLSKWKPVFEYIPLESQIEKFQNKYYEAISMCHTKGKSDFFIEFILHSVDKVLDEVLSQMDENFIYGSENVKRMIGVMEDDVSYTAYEIMEKIGIKSKETFRSSYMNPALEAGIVAMTIPDKPKSRNQRYVRKY